MIYLDTQIVAWLYSGLTDKLTGDDSVNNKFVKYALTQLVKLEMN